MTPTAFWQWFSHHANRLSGLLTGSALDEVYDKLKAVNGSLALEISEPDAFGVREIIVSANGDASLFDFVEELVRGAPEIATWVFISLKPPRGFDFKYRQGRKTLAPSEWEFSVLRDEANDLGLRIFIPGEPVILDQAVLETIIETGIGERNFSKVKHLEYTQSAESRGSGSWFDVGILRRLLESTTA